MWEQRLRLGRRGAQVRPFCQRATLTPRGYSLPLQRAMSDFGAEASFGRATEKLREHYGLELGASAVRQYTLAHAKALGAVEPDAPVSPVRTLITELDGSMIPVVKTGVREGDKRKAKEVFWREARLCCARAPEVVDGLYGATLGSGQVVGHLWQETATAAGLGPQTYVHGLGDGARWIQDLFQTQFGTQGKYLVDFWHVSDYLGQAGAVLAPQPPKVWLHEQQMHLLANEVAPVLQALARGLEPVEQKEAPVRSAHRYLQERQTQLDYARARSAGLPIGSGEVESGHRHVIQERLKLAGAWWLETTAECMLQLRAKRANRLWPKYWSEILKN